jgi:hypothetical protein
MSFAGLARSWRRRWLVGAAAAVAATGTVITVVTRVAGGAAGLAWLAGAVATAAAAWWAWSRRPVVDGRTVARHLNRVWPELEESAELLLDDPAALPPIARLQRARVRAALERRTALPALPHRALRWSLGYTGIALTAAGTLALWGGGRAARAGPAGPDGAPPAAARSGPLRWDGIEVEVRPPTYTRRAARRSRDWNVEAEAGSRVTWRLQVAGTPAAVTLVTSSGDTLALPRDDRGRYTGTLTAERSALYTLTARDAAGASLTSDFHALAVLPDVPPTITVLEPEPRTLVAPGESGAVRLRVLVGDDYGVAATRLVATLTTGSGEGVKFREQELAFERSSGRPDGRPGVVLERRLDARALGLGPGDELYFHVVARDTREPLPQESRSETYFVTLLDTAAVLVADFSGLAINLVPEYFRSQRQIIIDTERLLAERRRLEPQTFRNRSENIGLDQHALRLRYGEIVGDELVQGDEDPALAHEHDVEENATRLAPSVKATLRAALAHMWDAELRLRTHDPAGALPFEYRALELLKEVQQAARVYVRRVGFEPPPLEPDRKRLTGELGKIGRPTVTREAVPMDSLPAVRAALDVVGRLRAGGRARPADAAALEAAGQELARLAVADPGRHLDALHDLRVLLTALAGSTACADCLAPLERGLLRALPPAPPAEPGAVPAAGVARDYFDRLRVASP